MERKLTTILAADVVDYSGLMERDEAGTHERLKAGRKELFEPEIARHHGRIFKLMGDGMLAEFSSVVDAVECAVSLQRGLTERNAAVPEDQHIQVRIGINLGEVIVEGDDRFGEGVNIAARLEQLADPGGICVSGKVVKEVEKKLAFGFESMGEQKVKNIAEPVQAFRVKLNGMPVKRMAPVLPKRPMLAIALALLVVTAGALSWLRPWEAKIEAASIDRMALPLPDKPSIAVLPLVNMSADPTQDYFADGITDDLITELSRIPGLFVIARNTSFGYKGKALKIAQVAEELGVRYVLEGSIQRAGDRIRINAQLIDAISGGHVWADRFDGSLADVFAVQDEVTQITADALALRLTPAQNHLIAHQETSVPEAYEAFLRGWEHYRRTTLADYAKSVSYFKEATKLDPDYSRAYAALAMIYIRSYGRGWAGSLGLTRRQAHSEASRNLQKAFKRPNGLAHQAAGYIQLDNVSANEALTEFKKAIALEPSDSWSFALAAFALTTTGRATEAIPYIDAAMRLDPRPPALFLYYLGITHFNMEQFETAAKSLENATELNPHDEFAFLALAATYGHLGKQSEAKAAIERYNALEVAQGGVPATTNTPFDFYYPYGSPQYKRYNLGLRLAGAPETLATGDFADSNRLGADEVRSLMLGHHFHGISKETGETRTIVFTSDGIVSMSGDWVSGSSPLTNGIAEFKRDELCIRFDPQLYCGAVLRNPGGTKEKKNTYIWVSSHAFPFSQVE